MIVDNQKTSIILPGRIVEYFAETQTATVQVSAETIYNNAASLSESKTREPIEGVPVHTPSGGGWAITMPIEKGNTCLLFFSQIGYDHWLYEDKDTAGRLAKLPKPWLRRQFSENDGFALVGLNTLPRAIQAYSPENSEWRNEDATQVIKLKKDLSIEITSPTSVTINAPSVNVNCETATIEASTVVDIEAPVTNISDILNVGGIINGSGGMSIVGGSGASLTGNMEVTGGITTTSDVAASGVSLINHTHLDAENRPTDPPS